MGSGIHRIDLDDIFDLDLKEISDPDDDQRSSSSYSRTTAIPAQGYESNLHDKRNAIHPKLTYQRPNFDDVHRPSINLKELIKAVDINEGYNPPKTDIKSLPAIPRYQAENNYRPKYQSKVSSICPSILSRPEHECYNAPPSECYNDGFEDEKCPYGTVCCFDGCINLCWSPPKPSPPPLPSYSPHPGFEPPTLPPSPPPPTGTATILQYSTTYKPEEPLFYSPPPPDFRPKIGPPPVFDGPEGPQPSDYHLESKPLVPPKYPSKPEPARLGPYIPSNTYRTTSPPSYSTARPPIQYKPPENHYSPPLENSDSYPHSINSKSKIPEAKALNTEKEITPFSPPSQNYKEPSIRFENKPGSKSLTSHPSSYIPQADYLPPKEGKSLDAFPPKINSYQPPEKEYLPPTQSPKIAFPTYLPPRKEYYPPDLEHSRYRPPEKEYLPPSEVSNSYQPPSIGYIPPVKISLDTVHKGTPTPETHPASHMSTSFKPPEKEYLPPHSQMDQIHPPSKDYLPPPGYSTMQPPKLDYSPPQYASTMQPPNHDYLPPDPPSSKNIPSYKEDHVSTTMTPPELNHSVPKYDHLKLPTKDYLPPPRVSTMHPPSAEYQQPHFMSTTIEPPNKAYLPPEKHSPGKDYSGHQISTLAPPSLDYLPPSRPSPTPFKAIRYEPPSKEYLPPVKANHNDHEVHFQPPNKQYLPPKQMTHMEPPMYDYTLCPHFESKEKDHCHNINHECWSVGVPDEDCPYNGICCFDGCNNVCLNPEGHQIPSHHAHKVPGHEYVPSPRTLVQGADFHQRTLNTHNLAPMHEMEKVYHLVELQEDIKSPRTYSNERSKEGRKIDHFSPPNLEYLPPHKTNSNPVLDHISPPTQGYIPPVNEKVSKYSPPPGNYLPPLAGYSDDDESESYHSPSSEGYIAPQKNHHEKKLIHYSPPSEGYIPPNQNHHEEKLIHYSPPSEGYLPPQKNHHEEKLIHYSPPSEGYIPPHQNHHEEKLIHYSPPSEGYLPPQKSHNEKKLIHYSPPSESYLPPQKSHNEEELIHYSPPSEGYLPPQDKYYDKKLIHYSAPSEGDIPPQKNHHEEKLIHYSPPSEGYIPPKENYHEEKLIHYSPPSEGYIPPQKSHHEEKLIHYSPPSEGYIPPKENYQEEKLIHYSPPSEGYVPPHENPHKSHINKNHDLEPESYHTPEKDEKLIHYYSLPSVSYKVPTKTHLKMKLSPPTESYLPPPKYANPEDEELTKLSLPETSYLAHEKGKCR